MQYRNIKKKKKKYEEKDMSKFMLANGFSGNIVLVLGFFYGDWSAHLSLHLSPKMLECF